MKRVCPGHRPRRPRPGRIRRRRPRRSHPDPAHAVSLATTILDRIDAEPTDPVIPSSGDHPYSLTPREVEVLALVVAGRTNREIAGRLYVSHRTATTHVTNILAKLGVSTRTEATALALRQGLA